MPRIRKPVGVATGRPEGRRWTEWRNVLIRAWLRQGKPCFYCSHDLGSNPSLVEAGHLVSPLIAPELAWDRDNLVGCHGKGERRCKTCGNNCNWLAHNSPDASNDKPFTPEFMARQAANTRAKGKNTESLEQPIERKPPSSWAETGREW